MYNRQSDVGVFVKYLCKIEKVGSYDKIEKKKIEGLMWMLQVLLMWISVSLPDKILNLV